MKTIADYHYLVELIRSNDDVKQIDSYMSVLARLKRGFVELFVKKLFDHKIILMWIPCIQTIKKNMKTILTI